MAYNVPSPSGKPVWPIVVACLVLVAGIIVAAVFIGMNFSDSDEQASSGRGSPPAYASSGDDATDTSSKQKSGDESKKKSDGPQETGPAEQTDAPEKTDGPKDDASNEPEGDGETTKPKDDASKPEDPPKDEPESTDPRLACGQGSIVLTTRTATFGASICQTTDGDHIYRGLSDNIEGSLVLRATFNGADDTWTASNQTYEYIVDAETGHLVIRDRKTGEVYGDEPAVSFQSG